MILKMVSKAMCRRRRDSGDILIADPTSDRIATPAHAGDHATSQTLPPWLLAIRGIHRYRLRLTVLGAGGGSAKPSKGCKGFSWGATGVHCGGRSCLVGRGRLQGRCEIGGLITSRRSSARRRCSDVDGRRPTRHVQDRWWVIEEWKGGILEIGIEKGRVHVGSAAQTAMRVIPKEPAILHLDCLER